MKTRCSLLSATLGLALMAASPGISASLPDLTGAPQMVVTVLPGSGGSRPDNLVAGDLNVSLDKSPAPIARLQRLTGDLADMQLFLLLDDSTRFSSLSTHFKALKNFLNTLPPTTQVAIGYMRNGSFSLTQDFTADHEKASAALRLPMAMAGVNGSPYFALGDLVKHWPSTQPATRRAVLMLTDGVDRYWGSADLEDPYMEDAIHSALKRGVMVYSIYLSGAGAYGNFGRPLLFGQSHLIEVGEETGGHAYFQDLRDPVDIEPFLSDLRDRFEHQYLATFGSVHAKGFVPAKLHTESKSLKVVAPTLVYVP